MIQRKSHFMEARRKVVRVLAASALFSGAALPTPEAHAGAMKSVALYEEYKALSANPMYQWAGAVTARKITGEEPSASCVAVAPTVVAGAGHFTPGPTSTSIITTVTFGANCRTGQRIVMEVDHWERYPGYVSGNPNTIDLGVYYLKAPIPGFKPVTFADANLDDLLTLTDYGNYGDEAYTQDHLPVTQQDEALGHAVRAVYMYSGIADVAALTGEQAYIDAIGRIWEVPPNSLRCHEAGRR